MLALLNEKIRDDEGMSTIEYAMGSLAAAALAAVLFTVVNGDQVVNAITNIITSALSKSPS
ncbi:DUF4244 domain-containing protein [Corynebacterium hindlerae]|uniref:DUF4244 domain-containing protein n=1 Tax=Corynebacterium hindlerae TaxID=699041 RepID=A0A7G5FI44_9CORY|nr:DUF4244 domain-containing protein [Corynebacterium hindlerae]QMV86285.1 DUF4244 domain-containing protein [Corynebacterium hindlerae]QTH60074.1 DUF4244 domain-containing protein [Corynebacterium hindlerae]